MEWNMNYCKIYLQKNTFQISYKIKNLYFFRNFQINNEKRKRKCNLSQFKVQ